MSDLRDTLNNALKDAMKTKDNARRDVIRGLLSAVKQVEIDTRKDMLDDDVMAVLQKEAKKRRETIDEAGKAGRDEIVDAEQSELVILEEFLPRQLSPDEIKAIAQEIIAQTGATSGKDINKVIGPVMARVKGVADGKVVNQIVKELLG
ncbi:MAG: GatB/YqeY domain-containing protein [Armatimonadetes bacterium]|nr:GatB/YqeY domain-containing protein [Anaerolineae bacterium]